MILEKAIISGIAFSKDEAQLTIRGVPDQPGIASLILGPIAEHNIDVDMITCRALAPLNKLIDYVEFFLSKSSKKKKKFPKLLFLKGKNYRKELLELSTNKKIYFKEYPSLTDKYGKILYINKIDMLNFYNEQ